MELKGSTDTGDRIQPQPRHECSPLYAYTARKAEDGITAEDLSESSALTNNSPKRLHILWVDGNPRLNFQPSCSRRSPTLPFELVIFAHDNLMDNRSTDSVGFWTDFSNDTGVQVQTQCMVMSIGRAMSCYCARSAHSQPRSEAKSSRSLPHTKSRWKSRNASNRQIGSTSHASPSSHSDLASLRVAE